MSPSRPRRRATAAIRMRVHERGTSARLDGVLRVLELAGQARPLGELLAALTAEIAAVMRADVASVYVREADPDAGGDALVMRGNVGFPPGAVGQVRLAPGEGITGFVAECLRPVSCAVGSAEAQWKAIPGLGEERFPVFLAVPLLAEGTSLGVLVLQRRGARAFGHADIELAAALGAPVGHAIARARARRATLEAARTTVARTARLAGRVLAPGQAVGRLVALTPLGHVAPLASGPSARPLEVATAFAEVAALLHRGAARVHARLAPAVRAQLAMTTSLLDDQRVRELAVEECARAGVAAGLRRVAREYARAPYRAGVAAAEVGEWMVARAAEVEDLCMLVAGHLRGEAGLVAGDVVVAERLTTSLALAATARGVSGVVVTGPADPEALSAAILCAAGVPAVMEVAELFVWARPEDRVLVDGERGAAVVNPPPGSEARVRAAAHATRPPA